MDDPELADQLTMLRLADVEDLDKLLKASQKTKAWRGKTLFFSIKFRQKVPAPPDRPRDANLRSVHAVRAALEESSSEVSSLDDSDNKGDLRRIYLAEAEKDPSSRTMR